MCSGYLITLNLLRCLSQLEQNKLVAIVTLSKITCLFMNESLLVHFAGTKALLDASCSYACLDVA